MVRGTNNSFPFSVADLRQRTALLSPRLPEYTVSSSTRIAATVVPSYKRSEIEGKGKREGGRERERERERERKRERERERKRER